MLKGNSSSEQNYVLKELELGSDACTGLNSAVVEEILLNLPAEDVVLKCRSVCREWKLLVDSQSHWRERCRREGIEPCNASRTPADWCLFYFMTKKRRNLLKNPRAEDGLNGWIILENGGDRWKIEEVFKPLPNDKNDKCFATSYGLCLKQQVIDLEKEGYSPAFMDQMQPDIRISDWYAPRWDCGCYYEIFVDLLDEEMNPITVFQPEKVFFEQWNDKTWCQMTHVFKNYGPGVRFIRFTHGGQDTQYWAGWYGIRVINSSVEICPAAER
ncbi:F-box only protein 44-like isoform X2 [Misgurnus anguillicaudatus]|uniref:F-box only protein 44-like isoform X2 n=1 Tax=Misgurnus anguillicaudatus TaxID=75329 RepID=UPI003CCF05E7